MTFRQTLQDFQNGIAIPANLRPQIKQLLERSTPEEKRRILEELKSRQMRQQQQQQFHAQMGGAMDHPIGMQQGGQSISMMGQPNMMQPMGLQQVRPMQNQPMGMPQGWSNAKSTNGNATRWSATKPANGNAARANSKPANGWNASVKSFHRS